MPSVNGPDLYSISLSADGTQSVISGPPRQTANNCGRLKCLPSLTTNGVPDGFGGLIVTTCASGSPMTVIDLNATGQPLWQQAAIGVDNGNGFTYLCYPAPTAAVRGDGSGDNHNGADERRDCRP